MSTSDETPLGTVTRHLGGSGLEGVALIVLAYYGVLDFLWDEQKLVPADRIDLDLLLGRLTEPRRRHDCLQVMPVLCGPGNALLAYMLEVRWPDTRLVAPCALFPDPAPFTTPTQAVDTGHVSLPSAPPGWIALYTERDLERCATAIQSHVSGEEVPLGRRRQPFLLVIYPHGVAFVDAPEYTVVSMAMQRRLQPFALRYATSLERFKDVRPLLRHEILLYMERAGDLYNAYMTAYPALGWWVNREARGLGATMT